MLLLFKHGHCLWLSFWNHESQKMFSWFYQLWSYFASYRKAKLNRGFAGSHGQKSDESELWSHFFTNLLCLHGVSFILRLIPVGWLWVARRDTYIHVYIQGDRRHFWTNIPRKSWRFTITCPSKPWLCPEEWNVLTGFNYPGPTWSQDWSPFPPENVCCMGRLVGTLRKNEGMVGNEKYPLGKHLDLPS